MTILNLKSQFLRVFNLVLESQYYHSFFTYVTTLLIQAKWQFGIDHIYVLFVNFSLHFEIKLYFIIRNALVLNLLILFFDIEALLSSREFEYKGILV